MKNKLHICFKGIIKVNIILVLLTGFFLVNCQRSTTNVSATLEKGFNNPPESAKPRVWWHWLNGNITKEGIRADLEWMKRVGIGGFQNFEANMSTPQVVEKRLVYMTPEWKDAINFTTRLADSLGLEMSIAASPGWSGIGGPDVTPEQAMKKYVWSEIRVEGGKPFAGTVPKPPTTTGSFQNAKPSQGFGQVVNEGPQKEFYKDIAVVAFRVPDYDLPVEKLNPKVTSSGGKFNLISLTDGDLVETTLLPATPDGQNSWVQFEFDKPETIQSITVAIGGRGSRRGGSSETKDKSLEASDDGKIYRKILSFSNGGSAQTTYAFDPVTAKYFRFAFIPQRQQVQGGGMPRNSSSTALVGTQIAELVLNSGARVNRFEDKAGFSTATDLSTQATPMVSDAVKKEDIIDLTAKMRADSKLYWTPETGNWVILRLGYSLKGTKNNPAPLEATGLEVDKLSAYHVSTYLNGLLDKYKDATGGLMGKKGLQYMIVDSWEAGTLNWTDNMMEDFNQHRGYDILPWLPVLTGYVVESSKASDAFLWDFRKTIGDLTTENHFDLITKILKKRGMGRYSESHESGRAFVGDGMEAKRSADIPMSATWTPGGIGGSGTEVSTSYKADVRESASVSHIYGKTLVAAESLTASTTGWAWSPELLKPTADIELASGLNRFVIHTSVHQPLMDKVPGLSLGQFGQWFTRNETWADQAGPWMTYLSRSSFMLQQGKFVADVIYYYGEDNNITSLFSQKLPEVPQSYSFDFVNADALVNLLSVNKGKITTPGGMSYRLLALDNNSRYMTLPVLHKIYALVRAGAIVLGPKPIMTPSLKDDNAEFTSLVNELWATEKGSNTIGNGKLYSGHTIAEVLTTMNVVPDFEYSKPSEKTNLQYVHRKLKDIDIYWVNNRNTELENLEATFRIVGKVPEIWNPETGIIEDASYKITDGRTTVSLKLEPSDALFVVFRKKASLPSVTFPQLTETKLATIDGSWDISFQPNRGAPSQVTLEKLTSWSDNIDEGIKYFSGTGTYNKTFYSQPDWFREGAQLWLDLGDVKSMAEVIINGKSLGILWKKPFKVEMTGVLGEGKNTLEIKVTNLWVNRLIGDLQPGVVEKYTFTYYQYYQADSPLLPSGLMGPVQIIRLSQK